MPKARARSVAGFERPKACAEMAAEVAITVPDKEAGWRKQREESKRRDLFEEATPTMTPPSESLEGIATEASTAPSLEPPPHREKITIPADPPALSKQEMWERVRREVSNCSTSQSERVVHTVYTPTTEPAPPLVVHRVPSDYHSRATPEALHRGAPGSVRVPVAMAPTMRYGCSSVAAPPTSRVMSPRILSRQVAVKHSDITPRSSRPSVLTSPIAGGSAVLPRSVSTAIPVAQETMGKRPLLQQEVIPPRSAAWHEIQFQSRCAVPQMVWMPKT